jgi:hypothetical protein
MQALFDKNANLFGGLMLGVAFVALSGFGASFVVFYSKPKKL